MLFCLTELRHSYNFSGIIGGINFYGVSWLSSVSVCVLCDSMLSAEIHDSKEFCYCFYSVEKAVFEIANRILLAFYFAFTEFLVCFV